jgi:hypothetical protein
VLQPDGVQGRLHLFWRARRQGFILHLATSAISMRIQMNATHGRHALVALAAWVGLAGAASCLSSDDAPAGGRVEHPPQRAPIPVASTKEGQKGTHPPHQAPFTPLDQAIADDCPPRVWSQNVPDRDCSNDGECGDGFCDRGHCAAIWTCQAGFGQRCTRAVPRHFGSVPFEPFCVGICLDGRCRSCQSNAECAEEFGSGGIICNPVPIQAGSGRPCGIAGFSYGAKGR